MKEAHAKLEHKRASGGFGGNGQAGGSGRSNQGYQMSKND